ncbi:MAG: hypothetical protein R2911_39440 [Caldilineaceae bacterium]
MGRGRRSIGQSREPSFRVTWPQIIAAAPEVILLAPCGYSQAQAETEWAALPKPEGWHQLPAVRQRRVYALDANSYWPRPAVDGVEKLAALLHPSVL